MYDFVYILQRIFGPKDSRSINTYKIKRDAYKKNLVFVPTALLSTDLYYHDPNTDIYYVANPCGNITLRQISNDDHHILGILRKSIKNFY